MILYTLAKAVTEFDGEVTNKTSSMQSDVYQQRWYKGKCDVGRCTQHLDITCNYAQGPSSASSFMNNDELTHYILVPCCHEI